MSVLSSVILPRLTKELLVLEPEVAMFILKHMKALAHDVIEWAEEKLHIDLDGDGKIGEEEEVQ